MKSAWYLEGKEDGFMNGNSITNIRAKGGSANVSKIWI